MELTAQGTVVALTALGLLGLGGFLIWQSLEPTKLDPPPLPTEKPIDTSTQR